MECKGAKSREDLSEARGFNRNIVECKVVPEAPARDSLQVLIETLWNVKVYHRDVYSIRYGF